MAKSRWPRSQISVLLRKNFNLRKSTKCGTVCECILPVLIASAFVGFFFIFLSVDRSSDKFGPQPIQPLKQASKGTLLYSPAGHAGVETVINFLSASSGIKVRGFANGEEVVYDALQNSASVWTGLVFSLDETQMETGLLFIDPSHVTVNYTIRTPPILYTSDSQISLPSTFSLYGSVGSNVVSGPQRYRNAGIVSLMHHVDQALAVLAADSHAGRPPSPKILSSSVPQLQTLTELFPKNPDGTESPLSSINLARSTLAYFALAIWLSIAFFVPFFRMSIDMVDEKETKIREAMKMMGLRSSNYFVSWFLWVTIMSVPSTIVSVLLVASSGALEVSSVVPYLLFCILYNMSIVPLCFCVCTFVTRAKAAGLLSMVVVIALGALGIFVFDSTDIPNGAKVLLSVFSPVAFGLGSSEMIHETVLGNVLSFSNFSVGSPSFAVSFGMIALDLVLYCLVAAYLEQVIPNEFGTTKPWYFPLQCCFKCCSSRKSLSGYHLQEGDQQHLSAGVGGSPFTPEVEPIGRELAGQSPSISVRQLSKKYSNGTVGLKSLDVDFYEGQISALLGHNGAGKSTTFHILSGLLPPTGGDAHFGRLSIRTDLDAIRKNLGVCPQHDVLWEKLPVEEHLSIIAGLKGVPGSEIAGEVRRMLDELKLTGKRQAAAGTLSGGQKRKLCIGMALIGGSKIVFLDEPTSGVDPVARRFIWDVLQRNKAGRTMLLSTHFMDEADMLGDRIAILSRGRLRCLGSSLFLKSTFGIGYLLTVDRGESREPNSGTDPFMSCVLSHVPSATLLSDVARSIAVRLPRENVDAFGAMFREFDERKQELGVLSYGVSLTTLEEVFLRIADEVEEGIESTEELGKSMLERLSSLPPGMSFRVEQSEGVSLSTSVATNGSCSATGGYGACGKMSPSTVGVPEKQNRSMDRDVQGLDAVLVSATGSSFSRQLSALLKKRFLLMLRGWRSTLFQLILGLGFILVGLLIFALLSPSPPAPQPRIPMDPLLYSSKQIFPSSPSASAPGFMQEIPGYSTLEKTPLLPDTTALEQFLLKEGVENAETSRLVVAGLQVGSYDANLSNYTVWVNPRASHGLPAYLHASNVAATRVASSSSYSISAFVHPLPLQGFYDLGTGNFALLIFTVGFAFFPATRALWIVRERQVNAKHFQHTNGAGKFVYWLSHFIVDTCLNLVYTLGVMVICWSTVSEYRGSQESLAMFAMLSLYGMTSTVFVYFLSLGYQKPANALAGIMALVFIVGLFVQSGMISVAVNMGYGSLDIPILLQWPFYAISSNFNISFGMLKLVFYLGFGLDVAASAFSAEKIRGAGVFSFDEGVSSNLAFLGMHFVLFAALLLLVDMRVEIGAFFKRTCGGRSRGAHMPLDWEEDNDVAAERALVKDLWRQRSRHSSIMPRGVGVGATRHKGTGGGDSLQEGLLGHGGAMRPALGHEPSSYPMILLHQLHKAYHAPWNRSGRVVAVKNMSLQVAAGECFGLLGANGAGKTSTLSVVTGANLPTLGSAVIAGHDLSTDFRKAQSQVGYCPQFDALLDELTGREHLSLYAELKGIPPEKRKLVIRSMVQLVGLEDHADKVTKAYSGGNKRRLSLAIALLGNPPVVVLDEPSTGVDPVGKRAMWNVIDKVREGRAIVITSHSMEECDALCTRVGIMTLGQMVCLGTPQHLKSKFGSGYRVEIKLHHDAPTAPLEEWVVRTFPDAVLLDSHGILFNYEIPQHYSLADMFSCLQGATTPLGIQDYSVSQTTLEQIFLKKVHESENTVTPEPTSARGGWLDSFDYDSCCGWRQCCCLPVRKGCRTCCCKGCCYFGCCCKCPLCCTHPDPTTRCPVAHDDDDPESGMQPPT